jgi:hypothetical protein
MYFCHFQKTAPIKWSPKIGENSPNMTHPGLENKNGKDQKLHQGCNIFPYLIYQNKGKYYKLPLNYQVAIKYTQCTQYIPNGHAFSIQGPPYFTQILIPYHLATLNCTCIWSTKFKVGSISWPEKGTPKKGKQKGSTYMYDVIGSTAINPFPIWPIERFLHFLQLRPWLPDGLLSNQKSQCW